MYAYIGIGSNLGQRKENIKSAIAHIRKISGIKIEKISSIIETDAVGGPPQPKYLNAVIKIKTSLKPKSLLTILQGIEKKMKRIRTVTNGPRVIDLDILLYGQKKINEIDLKIPHPRMLEREFVMKPLCEIEPSFRLKTAK